MLSTIYSTFAAEGLAELVAARYGLRAPQVTLLRRGFNDNYRVVAGPDRFVLRIYLHGKYYISGPADLQFELDLLDHLAGAGVGVAPALPMLSGERLGQIEGPEGRRYFALFRYASGAPVAEPTVDQVRALGREVARIHLAVDRFQSALPRQSLGVDALIGAALRRLAPYLADQPADLTLLQAKAAETRATIESLTLPPGAWGIIHGDPHSGNCHFDGERPVFFDFDTCGYGYRAYDIAIAKADGEAEEAFLEAYQAVRPLSTQEVGALPAFTLARQIWDAGDILTMAPVWGEQAMKRTVAGLIRELRKGDDHEDR